MRNPKCFRCDNVLPPRKSKFCSNNCSKKTIALNQENRRLEARQNLECITCNKKLSGNQKRFCSLLCTNKHGTSITKIKNFKKPNKKCNNCNNILKSNLYKYCSRDCLKTGREQTLVMQRSKRLTARLKLIYMFGGCCNHCGYNKNHSALHFHHIDPKTKSFNINTHGVKINDWVKILKEAAKCLLLCANCHAEEHHPKCLMIKNQ